MFNFQTTRVGGLRFVRIGRLTFSFSVSHRFRPLGSAERVPKARRYTSRQLDRAFQQGMTRGRIDTARRAFAMMRGEHVEA